MSDATPARVQADIVVVGTFAPGMFHPEWFARHGLIDAAEAETSRVDVVTSDVTNFGIGDWLAIQILPERAQFVTTLEPYFGIMRDMTSSVLRILKETRVGAIGINWHGHFSAGSEDRWHEIGHTLVPKEYWSTFTVTPGLKNVAIKDVRDDDYAGERNFIVQPSNLIADSIYLQLNDHFVNLESNSGSAWGLNIIDNEWAHSRERFNSFHEAIMSVST